MGEETCFPDLACESVCRSRLFGDVIVVVGGFVRDSGGGFGGCCCDGVGGGFGVRGGIDWFAGALDELLEQSHCIVDVVYRTMFLIGSEGGSSAWTEVLG
jgi:hypothetical protein